MNISMQLCHLTNWLNEKTDKLFESNGCDTLLAVILSTWGFDSQ